MMTLRRELKHYKPFAFVRLLFLCVDKTPFYLHLNISYITEDTLEYLTWNTDITFGSKACKAFAADSTLHVY